MTTEQKEFPIEIKSLDESVVLRELTAEDVPELFGLIDSNREHLSQHGDDTARKYPTLETVLESIVRAKNPDRLRFGIRNREGILVGSINLTPEKTDYEIGEIGYYLGEAYTGKGYTVAAVEALTRFGFDNLGYQMIYGRVVEANIASIKVLQRAGYVETETRNGEVYLYRRNIALLA